MNLNVKLNTSALKNTLKWKKHNLGDTENSTYPDTDLELSQVSDEGNNCVKHSNKRPRVKMCPAIPIFYTLSPPCHAIAVGVLIGFFQTKHDVLGFKGSAPKSNRTSFLQI